MLVRLRARPANLLNGAKFFSISISSCRLLTFCGCYSSCFCQCCCCCWCVCVCVCWLPAAVVCVVRVAKYLHSNSIGCVLCLLPFARCCQNWKRWTLSQVFSIFSMSSAAQLSLSVLTERSVRWADQVNCAHCPLSLSLSLANRLLSVCYANGNSNELPTIWTRMSNALANKNSGRGHALLFLFGLAAGLGLVCTADIFGQVCAALKRKNHSKNCKRWKKMSTNSLRIRRVVQSNDQLWQNMPGKCV